MHLCSTNQQSQYRSVDHKQIMSRINQQLIQVMSSNRQIEYQQKSKAQLVYQIQKLKRQFSQQLQSLKLKQHLQDSTYSFMQQQNKIKYQQLQHERDCLKFENQKIREQLFKKNEQIENYEYLISKYQNKIRNQQNLIDQYKRSLQQQINLQKQVIKSSFMEKQLAQKIQFQKALKCIQQNYQRKIQQIKQHSFVTQYKNEVQTVKKFFKTLNKSKNKTGLMDQYQTSNKKNTCNNKQNICRSSTKKLITVSSYSTLQK